MTLTYPNPPVHPVRTITRDAWCYNNSRSALASNIERMVGFYNTELDRFDAAFGSADRKAREKAVDSFVNTDPSKISWTRALKGDFVKGKRYSFDGECLTPSLYRPFTKQYLYYSRAFNEMVYQMPRLFPMKEKGIENRVIMVEGSWRGRGNIAVMVNDIACQPPDGGCQCFPLYLYNNDVLTSDDTQGKLLTPNATSTDRLQRRDAITNEGLKHFQAAYPAETIAKDDLFHYVYGLLHSEDYRSRYADNLSKELPRIPALKQGRRFLALRQRWPQAGRPALRL
jgi:predicted helicase